MGHTLALPEKKKRTIRGEEGETIQMGVKGAPPTGGSRIIKKGYRTIEKAIQTAHIRRYLTTLGRKRRRR